MGHYENHKDKHVLTHVVYRPPVSPLSLLTSQRGIQSRHCRANVCVCVCVCASVCLIHFWWATVTLRRERRVLLQSGLRQRHSSAVLPSSGWIQNIFRVRTTSNLIQCITLWVSQIHHEILTEHILWLGFTNKKIFSNPIKLWFDNLKSFCKLEN